MKAILRYTITKEKEIDINENTFATTESILAFWSQIQKAENAISAKGIYIKDPTTGKRIYK